MAREAPPAPYDAVALPREEVLVLRPSVYISNFLERLHALMQVAAAPRALLELVPYPPARPLDALEYLPAVLDDDIVVGMHEEVRGHEA